MTRQDTEVPTVSAAASSHRPRDTSSNGSLAIVTVGDVAGDVIRLAYVGPARHARFIQPFVEFRLFGDHRYSRVYAGSEAGETDVAAAQVGEDVSITIGGDELLSACLSARSYVVPLYLRLFVEFSPQGEPLRQPSSSERKRQRQRLARYQYSCEVSNDDSDFYSFYHGMYLPTMRNRHGSRAHVLDERSAFDDIFKSGMVFWLTSHGVKVAGVLCNFDNRVCNARLVGWLDGGQVHLEREALKTANHLLIGWAGAAGFRILDFKGCDPFVSKGTYQSKRHLGVRAALDLSEQAYARLQFAAVPEKFCIRDFLAANPPILMNSGGDLGVGFFSDQHRPERANLPYACPGIEFKRSIDIDDFLE